MLLAGMLCHAATYTLSEGDDDLIGRLVEVTIAADDTLADVARRHDLGFNEIVAANPDIDPWLPAEGARVVVPTMFIIPSAPRNGIIINLAEMRLYYFPPPEQDGKVDVLEIVTYPLGIGSEGWSTPVGITTVIDKIVDPAWTVPESILEEYAKEGHVLPKIVPPGPDNPLGRFALRLDKTKFLIHGTNKPFGVGRRISHGCLRMYPEDIEDLFNRVAVGTRVEVVDQPYKIGRHNGELVLESHDPIVEPGVGGHDNLQQILSTVSAITPSGQRKGVLERAVEVAGRHSGIPSRVAEVSIDHRLSDGWVIQIGAFGELDNAFKLAARIEALDLPVSVQASSNDGYCHVLVGPYETQTSVMEVTDRLSRAIGINGRLLRADHYGLMSHCIP